MNMLYLKGSFRGWKKLELSLNFVMVRLFLFRVFLSVSPIRFDGWSYFGSLSFCFQLIIRNELMEHTDFSLRRRWTFVSRTDIIMREAIPLSLERSPMKTLLKCELPSVSTHWVLLYFHLCHDSRFSLHSHSDVHVVSSSDESSGQTVSFDLSPNKHIPVIH